VLKKNDRGAQDFLSTWLTFLDLITFVLS